MNDLGMVAKRLETLRYQITEVTRAFSEKATIITQLVDHEIGIIQRMVKEVSVLFPSQSKLDAVKEEEDTALQCYECKAVFKSGDIVWEALPSNFKVFGLADNAEIPKCPKCDSAHFFGFLNPPEDDTKEAKDRTSA